MCQLTIVTTAGRPDDVTMKLAQFACNELGLPFEPRKKRSVAKMSELLNANIIVAGKNRFEYYPKDVKNPFFFHPGTAAFRLKRIANGEIDPFLEACNLLKGDTYLDCTLGLGSDAIVAAYQVGHLGKVTALEANRNVAFIVKQGMKNYDYSELPLTSCMREIEVINAEALDYLSKQQNGSIDVIYMDPMFEEIIEESNNFEPLRDAGNHDLLTREWVQEAIRVARKRVVLKAHYKSSYFDEFGFKREVRLTSKFHYGVIEKTTP
ncbi:Putative SAM-dependent methyltransferase OS=Ureibacillus acetophenoni OX=614649 GN=SAMN05877842_103226 PE=4 SV=1 [Ureibacillus acetophenoni]